MKANEQEMATEALRKKTNSPQKLPKIQRKSKRKNSKCEDAAIDTAGLVMNSDDDDEDNTDSLNELSFENMSISTNNLKEFSTFEEDFNKKKKKNSRKSKKSHKNPPPNGIVFILYFRL